MGVDLRSCHRLENIWNSRKGKLEALRVLIQDPIVDAEAIFVLLVCEDDRRSELGQGNLNESGGCKLLNLLFSDKFQLVGEAAEMTLVRESVGGDREIDSHRRKLGGLLRKVDPEYSGYFDEELEVGT